MRITHLTLKNWRNFKAVDADVGERLVVVGANASGKSNLLDSLRFLRDIARVGGGFQQAMATRGGVSRVRCLAARSFNHGRVGLAVHLGDEADLNQWVYELNFSAEKRGLHRPILTSETVWRNGEKILSRPDDSDLQDPELLTQTALEQVSANKDFREVADFFSSLRYRHLVPQVLREPERGSEVEDDPYGGDFLLQIARTPEKTRRRRLGKINSALKLAVPQLDELDLVRDADGSPHIEARYQHWREVGARQNERDFSDGTIRLIGLLWSLLESGKNAGPLLMEEPELSLHTSVVRQLPTILASVQRAGGPQSLLTTHATEILADEGLGKHEVLVLVPGDDGTTAQLVTDIEGAQDLLDSGMGLDEIVRPLIEPGRVGQLSFFSA